MRAPIGLAIGHCRSKEGTNMSRLRIPFLLTAVLLFGAHSVLAADYAVGTCKPSLHSYPSISAAVSSVPAGSTVEVCPGTYAEQVNISTPLTLEGISSGNSNQTIITVPSEGLSENGPGLAAQVLVTGVSPVNITNITVDGTGNNLSGSIYLAGIYYASGPSGVIKDVTARDQMDAGKGVGIWVENTNGAAQSVTIEDCSVHDFDYSGIIVSGNLTSAVKSNHVNASKATSFVYGIFVEAAGTVTDNDVTGPGVIVDAEGIAVETPSTTISGNVLTNWQFAFIDFEAAKYTSNTVRNVEDGFYLDVVGATVESNTITQVSNVGIEFNCNSETVKSNTINDAHTGIIDVPTGLSSANTYFNVATLQSTCGDDASAALSKATVTPRRPIVVQ
jgi:hypothetical protein